MNIEWNSEISFKINMMLTPEDIYAMNNLFEALYSQRTDWSTDSQNIIVMFHQSLEKMYSLVQNHTQKTIFGPAR